MTRIVYFLAIVTIVILSVIPILFLHCVENFAKLACDESMSAFYIKNDGLHYNIAVLTLTDNYIGENVVQKSIANKAAYAKPWNFELIIPSRQELEKFDFVKKREKDFMKRSKFAYVRKILPLYDAVFWIDIDAIIMRHDVNLNVLLQDMINANKSVAMAQTRHLTNMLNSGVAMFRNAPSTHEFLDEFVKAHPLITKCRQMHMCAAQLYDQNILSYLINRWPTCGLGGRILYHYSPVHPYWRKYNDMMQELPACIFNEIETNTKNATFIEHCYGGGLDITSMSTYSKQKCMSRALTKSMVF